MLFQELLVRGNRGSVVKFVMELENRCRTRVRIGNGGDVLGRVIWSVGGRLGQESKRRRGPIGALVGIVCIHTQISGAYYFLTGHSFAKFFIRNIKNFGVA